MTTKVITGIALAVATVLATPAFAQPVFPGYWDGYQAYAQGPRGVIVNDYRGAPRQPWDVYNTYGRYVGADPDPNVRQMIQRDRAEQFNGGY